jgi:hypothetical protein
METDESLLAQLYSASVQRRITNGPQAGQRLLRLGDHIDADRVARLAALAPPPTNEEREIPLSDRHVMVSRRRGPTLHGSRAATRAQGSLLSDLGSMWML